MSVRDQTGVDPGPLDLEIPADPSATEEDTRPEWLDPKFESPEDQAKAYAEAQREMSRAQASERQAQQQLEQWAAQQQYEPEPAPQQQPGNDTATLSEIWQEAVENGDARTMFGVQTLLAQQQAEMKLEEFKQQMAPNPRDSQQNAQMFAVLAEQQAAAQIGEEWEALKPTIGDLLTEHPHLLPRDGDLAKTVNALSLVAEMARARTGATAQAAAVDAGRQQKLMAQGISGGSGRPDAQHVAAADQLADLMRNIR